MPSAVVAVMGTTATLDVRGPLPAAVLRAAFEVLHAADRRFSTYRDDSEVARLGRGEITAAEAHPDVREVLAACGVLRAESGGAFDAWRDGHLDPSGYVKGWAAERAADVVRAAGARDFGLNLGGDVICAGEREPGLPWRVGVRDPSDPARVLAVLGVRDLAVATSGLYERGDHVRHAATGAVPTAWRSITVVAADLATADALATAALAMGEGGPAWAAARHGCEVGALAADGRWLTTPGFETLRIA